MHTLGMGGWLGLFIVIAQAKDMLMSWPLACVIFLCGLVATARFIISDHSDKEIYSGFIVGLLTQLVAAFIIL